MKERKPLVSIIIVNWNGGEVFQKCLESLSEIDYRNTELIVVDNGSTDGSEKLAKKAKIIKNKKNLGFAPANNQGFKISKGEYVLLLNNDTVVNKDFLSKLIERMEQDETIGVLQPKIFMMRKKGRLDNAGSFFTRIGFLEHWGFDKKDGKEFQEEREIFSAKGACMLIRREVIEKVGLFDADFGSYFEESDFCWRVWMNGWRILFYPKAKIHHKIGYTIRRLNVREMNYDYYRNRISSLIKNLTTKNLIYILPVHIIISVGISFMFFIKLKYKNALMILKAIAWNLLNIEKTLKKRATIQSQRAVSDDEIFAKLAHKIDWLKYYKDFRRVEEDIER